MPFFRLCFGIVFRPQNWTQFRDGYQDHSRVGVEPRTIVQNDPMHDTEASPQRWRSSGEVPRVSPWLMLEADALSLTTTKLRLCMDGCDSQVGVECAPSRQDLMRVSKLGYVSLTDLIVTPNSLVPAHFGWTKGSSEAAVANCDNFALRRMTAAERKRTQRKGSPNGVAHGGGQPGNQNASNTPRKR